MADPPPPPESEVAVPSLAQPTLAATFEGDGGCPITVAVAETSLSDSANLEKADAPVCRICLDGASAGSLRKVCGCQGTMGGLHHHCLMRWLGLSKIDHCELCLQPLPVRVQQPGVLQYAINGPRRNHCLIALDVLSLLLITPLIVYCNLLSLSALQHFRELQYLKLRQYSFWEICFGVVLTPFVLSGYLLWVCFVCKSHHTDFRRWRMDQRRVTLCTELDAAS